MGYELRRLICGITPHTKDQPLFLRRYIGSDGDDEKHHDEKHEGDDGDDDDEEEEGGGGVLGAAGLTAI